MKTFLSHANSTYLIKRSDLPDVWPDEMKRRSLAQVLAFFVRTMLEAVTLEVEVDAHDFRRFRVPGKNITCITKNVG